MGQDGGMSVLRTLGQATALTARVTGRATASGVRTGRFLVRHVTVARRRGAAGEAGMMRLLDLHAASCAGDTLVAIGLAGTIFFAVPVGEARGRVALYLLVTMLPFALLAPVVGPVLDRFRHGRRYALSITMLARAFLAYMISEHIGGFTLYPAAFAILVFSRAYGVARSAAVPRLLPEGLGLSEAGARASVFGAFAGAVVAPIGLLAYVIGPAWPLRLAMLVFIVGAVVALRLPPRADSQPPEAVPRPFQLPGHKGAKVLSGRLVLATLAGSATLRALYGFLALFLAFTVRSGKLPTDLLAWKLSQAAALGVVAGALAVGSFLATAVGTTLRIRRPAPLQATVIVIVAVAAAVAAARYTLPVIVALCLLTALASGLAKLAVDAVIQERVDEEVRASAFAHAETLLMLAWVAGGALGLIPLAGRWGLVLVAGFLIFGAARALIGALRLRRERLRTGPTEAPTRESARSQPPDRDRTGRLPESGRSWRRKRPAPSPRSEASTKVLVDPAPEATNGRLPEAPVSPAPAGPGPGPGSGTADAPGYHLYRPSGRDTTRRLDEDED
jgi:MFS family permease